MVAQTGRPGDPAFPVGGGEMGALIHAHDWATTPLGSIAGWPQSLRTVVQLVLDAPVAHLVLWGPDLLQLYNDSYRVMIGSTHPAALGQPARECWPALWQVIAPIYGRVLRGESLAFEDAPFRLTRAGVLEDVWFTVSYIPIRDETNAVVGIFVRVMETTERQRAAVALRERDDCQAFLLELSDALRPLADVAAIQGAACGLLGERLGVQRAYYVEMREAEDRALVEQDYVQGGLPSLVGEIPLAAFRWVMPLYKLGRPVVVDDLHTAELVPEPDRAAMAAVQIIAWIAIPLVKSGELVGALCVGEAQPRAWRSGEVALVEATAERIWAAIERGRAEAALREIEVRRHLALDAAELGTFVWYPQEDRGEPDARMLALFGLGEGGMLNLAEALATMIHPDDGQLYAEAVANATDPSGDGKLREDIRVQYPDTSLHWIAITAQTRFEGEPQRAVRMYGTAVDITERKQLERAQMEARLAAEAAVRAREEFMSIASHELRNLVATLAGTAQLLRRAHASGRLTDERLGAYIESLERAGAHLVALTNDLLDVARLQRGELPFRPETADVAELLRDIVRPGDWPGHRVIMEGVGEPLDAEIDVNRIRQVVTNLLVNAVKYSPSADEVRLRLRRDGAGLLIEVQDFGIGLPPNCEETIFTPFQRAPNASATGIPGLGLGLFIARRIAEQHGGRLWAQSEGEGGGTTMSLWLPLQPAEPEQRSNEGANRA